MMKLRYIIMVLLMAAPGIAGRLAGQELQALKHERVSLVSDRALYISGEEIHFSAVLIPAPDADDAEERSKVLYLELVAPGGEAVARGKYLFLNGQAAGSLQVPETALTGVYCLKAYTRLMRNAGPSCYHYSLIRLVHPRLPEVAGDFEPGAGTHYYLDAGQYAGEACPVKVSAGRAVYKPGEEVAISLLPENEEGLGKHFCLGVVPAYSLNEPALAPAGPSATGTGSLPQFPAETRGLSLSGRVHDRDSGKPMVNCPVNLAVLGDRDIMTCLTGASGQFNFVLPGHCGARDIFLSAAEPGDQVPEIMVDNDFCPEPVPVVFPPFRLDSTEMETVYRMAVHHLTSPSDDDTLQALNAGDTAGGHPFYGQPDAVITLEKYIDLPTLEEYFNELPVMARVRKSQGRKYFRFNSLQPEMSVYEPLVLVDWVPVTDMDRVLAIPPKAVDRIELVNSPYVKGDRVYGGIISFISVDNDFAGIDLPSSGIFLSYEFLRDCHNHGATGSSVAGLPAGGNTAYWDPLIIFDTPIAQRAVFTAPAFPGDYIIRLLGWDENGERCQAQAGFRVEE